MQVALICCVDPLPCTCIVPLRSERSLAASELTPYFRWLGTRTEAIVVDGSPPEVFAEHERAWGAVVRHMRPASDLATPMGKVGGVLTGVRFASHERLIIADDDVRYDDRSLQAVHDGLASAGVVRPQNYFTPLPWHAAWDTGRTLLNRISGGDWPGTLGVRRSILIGTGGYDGRAMFENLELVRTVRATGASELVQPDVFVARRPSTFRHFVSQRVRQAYDEFARPARLAIQLAVLPLAILIGWRSGAAALGGCLVAIVLLAETGRRRHGGIAVFPRATPLYAPLWVAERAVCSWLALGSRIIHGGVPYRGKILAHAATPAQVLRARHGSLRSAPAPECAAPPRSA